MNATEYIETASQPTFDVPRSNAMNKMQRCSPDVATGACGPVIIVARYLSVKQSTDLFHCIAVCGLETVTELEVTSQSRYQMLFRCIRFPNTLLHIKNN